MFRTKSPDDIETLKLSQCLLICKGVSDIYSAPKGFTEAESQCLLICKGVSDMENKIGKNVLIMSQCLLICKGVSDKNINLFFSSETSLNAY